MSLMWQAAQPPNGGGGNRRWRERPAAFVSVAPLRGLADLHGASPHGQSFTDARSAEAAMATQASPNPAAERRATWPRAMVRAKAPGRRQGVHTCTPNPTCPAVGCDRAENGRASAMA